MEAGPSLYSLVGQPGTDSQRRQENWGRGKGVRSLMEYIVPHSPGRGKVTTYELLFDGRGREGELTLCVFSVDF